ncbi:MAG: HAD family hydrolase [Clostridiaceae bacterium]
MKNIIFDVDGTLWNTTEVVAKSWNKAISEVGGTEAKVTASILQKEFGKPMDVIADNLFHDVDKEKRFLILEQCCKYEHDYILEHTDDLLYPDVKETIKKLSEKFGLYIVSNCQSGYIELFMEKAGIKEYIKDHECFGNTSKNKGENIKHLIERNNLDDVFYVGDTQGDYEATVFAGIPFIFAEYGFGNVESYYMTIGNIKELLNLT